MILNPNSKLMVAGIAVLGAVLIAMIVTLAMRPPANSGPVVRSGPVKVSGEAQIGGPFTLVNHLGETVTEADFQGKAMLIYFGFTYCPDICPTALQSMNVALSQLSDQERAQFQPVLITIDPERDTPEALEQYVTAEVFPENLVGLTGTLEQIEDVARAYRVYYARIDDDESYAQYLMDHTSVMFLMDETGQFADLFADKTDPLTIASRLQYFLENRVVN